MRRWKPIIAGSIIAIGTVCYLINREQTGRWGFVTVVVSIPKGIAADAKLKDLSLNIDGAKWESIGLLRNDVSSAEHVDVTLRGEECPKRGWTDGSLSNEYRNLLEHKIASEFGIATNRVKVQP